MVLSNLFKVQVFGLFFLELIVPTKKIMPKSDVLRAQTEREKTPSIYVRIAEVTQSYAWSCSIL